MEFIDGFIELYNEEQEEKTIWELWLHKIFDKSFAEFRNSLNTQANKTAAPTQEDVTNTIRESMDILNGFNPPSEGVKNKDGTVQAAGDNSS